VRHNAEEVFMSGEEESRRNGFAMEGEAGFLTIWEQSSRTVPIDQSNRFANHSATIPAGRQIRLGSMRGSVEGIAIS